MTSEIAELGKRAVVPNLLKAKMARGELAFTWITYLIPRHEMVGYTAQCGYDALIVDLEHGTIGLDQAGLLCCSAMAEGVTPIIRVPEATFEWIGRSLEFGAQGVIVPQVQSAAEARTIVKHAKYPPLGGRSIGASLPSLRYHTLPFELTGKLLNEETLIVVIIETEAGLQDIENIAAVPGIDVLMIGTPDLLGDWGMDGEIESPRFVAAVDRVVMAANAASVNGNKVYVGLGGFSGRLDLLEQYARKYPCIRYATAGADGGTLQAAMKAKAAQVARVSAAIAGK